MDPFKGTPEALNPLGLLWVGFGVQGIGPWVLGFGFEKGSTRVPLKGSIRVPLKGSIGVQGFRVLGFGFLGVSGFGLWTTEALL